RIKWARCLMYNMTETVESVCAHPVLRALPTAADMMRKYAATRTLIHNYEETMRAVWMNQNLWDVDDSLTNTLLKIDESGRITVNLDHTIKLLIRESDCLVKMGLELPIVCHSLYAKKNYFTLVNDSLQVSSYHV
ncbi:jg4780, partial [Pararge aegeria aegeria]